MKHLCFLFLAGLLGGCAMLGTPARLTQLPLPAPHQLDCCWQSQERVRISTDGDSFTLSAAVAVTPDQLTLVAFDGLGRRLVALTHNGGTPQTLEAPPCWSAALSHQLLVAIYLHHLPVDAWRFDEPGWSVSGDNGLKVVRHGERLLAQLHYLSTDATTEGREIDYAGQNVRLTVHTLSRTGL